MVDSAQVRALFDDARLLYDDALEMLAQGRTRNAAEKAWGATKRATDALVLGRTGTEPRSSGKTSQAMRLLQREDPAIGQLRVRYLARQSELHGACFYDGNCEPEDVIASDIRETIDYIRDAESLAVGHGPS